MTDQEEEYFFSSDEACGLTAADYDRYVDECMKESIGQALIELGSQDRFEVKPRVTRMLVWSAKIQSEYGIDRGVACCVLRDILFAHYTKN